MNLRGLLPNLGSVNFWVSSVAHRALRRVLRALGLRS